MSGEYYTFEEVGKSSNYLEGFGAETNRSDKLDNQDFSQSGNNDNNTKKSQDSHLSEIEQELQMAENRCNKLKSQLDFMKKNYQTNIIPPDSVHTRNREERPSKSKHQRTRSVLVPPNTSTGISSTLYLQNGFCEGSLSSKLPSSPVVDIEDFKQKSFLIRQNSNSINTDNSGAAVKTITNILDGITDFSNRTSQVHNKDYNLQYAYVEQPFSNDLAAISGKTFSPRLKKRLHEQQKKLEELSRETQFVALNDIKIQTSVANIKHKETVAEKWSKRITGRVKPATATTSKLNAKETQPLYKKRRSIVKRLLSTSKIHEPPKPISGSTAQFRKFNYSTDDLIELYHNVATKSSDSDVSNHINRLDTKQGGGDVYTKTTFTSYVSDDKSGTRLPQSSNFLSPIKENMIVKNNLIKRHYFHRNYETPTVSSKLKRVTKNYLRSLNYFNFKCIPFCAAKSTSPSHNIGVNIQQVLSVIKSKQPINGISPTLAHNINLVSEKYQGSPLSTFVSNLNTRIGNSACPLVKRPINFNNLLEIAKTIPEEPFEEEEADQNHIVPTEVRSNNIVETATKNFESPTMNPPIWSAAPNSTRCTCTSQKGVPFQKILNKYKIATSEIDPLSFKQKSKIQTNPRQTHTANYKNSKQRTADWVSNGIKENSHTYNVAGQFKPSDEPHDQNELSGRAKNLKAVLTNLHDEFDNLNNKHDELLKSSTKSNPHTVKMLKDVEQQLNKKEEEINMVMSLFTEVKALKDQVKKMKERSSCETIPVEKKESSPTSHLTQLLQQIQNYQNRFPK